MNLFYFLTFLLAFFALSILFSIMKYIKEAKNIIFDLETHYPEIWEEIGKPNIYSALTLFPSRYNATDFQKQKSFLKWLNSRDFTLLNTQTKRNAVSTRKYLYRTIGYSIAFMFSAMAMILFCLTNG